MAAGAAAAGAPVGAATEESDRRTIRELLYPRREALVGAGRQVGGRVIDAADTPIVERALGPDEETWADLRQHLERIAADTNRVTQIKNEVLFRMAKGEERGDRTIRPFVSQLEKFITAFRPDVNARGENGVTPLMQAAVNNRGFHVHALLKAGANPNLQNSMGETALMWAAAYGAETPIRHFREQTNVPNPTPVDFDAVDNLGWNALMIAAWCGNYASVDRLYSKTNNKTRRDTWGRDATALARDPASPARLRTTPDDNVVETVASILAGRSRTATRGGRRTYRSKTKDKKRGTR
jgi:hypothetical protein